MKKISLLPLVIIGGIGIWYLLRLRNLGVNLIYVIRSIRIAGGSILQPNIEIAIGIQNASTASARLKSLTGELLLENTVIANFSNFENNLIKGNSETIVKITAIPNVINVLTIVKDIILKKQKGKIFKLNGRANVNDVIVPFVTTYQF